MCSSEDFHSERMSLSYFKCFNSTTFSILSLAQIGIPRSIEEVCTVYASNRPIHTSNELRPHGHATPQGHPDHSSQRRGYPRGHSLAAPQMPMIAMPSQLQPSGASPKTR